MNSLFYASFSKGWLIVRQWLKKIKKQQWYVLALITIVAVGIFLYSDREQEQPSSPLRELSSEETIPKETKKEDKPQSNTIVVDVKGAVVRPGVYEVMEYARVHDVITLAGGLTKEADQTKINLAAKVHDEMMIYVPKKGEAAPASNAVGKSPSDGDRNGMQVAINTATEEELMQLPGIGPAKANAIIAYREEHGPFRRVEDLLNVTGIGEKTLEKLKPYLLVP